MKIKSFVKKIGFLAVGAAIFTSCEKTKDANEVFGLGETIVLLLDAGPETAPVVKTNSIDFVNTPTTIIAADIRRDVPNPSELSKTMVVMVLDDTAAVTASGLTHLPRNYFQVGNATPKEAGSGGIDSFYRITMVAGEIAKGINITIPDATLLDPSTVYGLGFKIVTVDAGGRISNASQRIVAAIGAKNIYDGVYELTFSNYHPTLNPGYDGDVTEVQMITTGANTVKIFWPDAAGFANPAILSGTFSYFGAQEPEYTVNTTTNKVTVQNAFAGATTFYTMNPGFNSFYDPGTKVIQAKWGYSYVGGTFALGTSREWTQTFRYLRSR